MNNSFHDRYRKRRSLIGRLLYLPLAFLTWLNGLFSATLNRFQRNPSAAQAIRAPLWQNILWAIFSPIALGIPFLWRFFVGWTSTRRGWSLLIGLPAILVAGSAIGGLAYSKYVFGSKIVRVYERAIDKSSAAQDLEASELYLKKVISLLPNHYRHQFNLAQIFLRQAELETDATKKRIKQREAVQLLNRISTPDKPGFSRAHVWQADQILRKKSRTKEDIDLAYRHLEWALVTTPNDVLALQLAAQTALMKKLPSKAEDHLKVAAKSSKFHLLNLAKVQKMLSKKEAEENARACKTHFEEKAKMEPTKSEYWAGVFDCYLFLEEYDKAINSLRIAIKFAEDIQTKAKFASASSSAMVLWSRKFPKDVGDALSFKKRLRLISEALRIDPKNKLALAELGNMTLDVENEEDDEKIDEMLSEALVQGVAPGLVHLILGSRHALKGKNDEAIFHLKHSSKHNPRSATVMNNLAWVFAHRKDPDYKKALDFANSAIKVEKNPRFLHTRGIILAKLDRNEEALIDFEKALVYMKDNLSIHDALGTIYEKMGKSILAAQHKKKAQLLRKQKTKDADKKFQLSTDDESQNNLKKAPDAID